VRPFPTLTPATSIDDRQEQLATYLASTERVVARIRLAALLLYALAETIPHPDRTRAAYYITLALYTVWSVFAIVWVHRRPGDRRIGLTLPTIDIIAITALTALSGGPYSYARYGYFLVPMLISFRLRPRVTAVAAAASTVAWVAQSLPHPDSGQPGAARLIVLLTGFIALNGIGCTALTDVLARRTRRVISLVESRERLLADTLNAGDYERQVLAESLHDHAIQDFLAARQEIELVRAANGSDAELGRVSEQLLVGVRSLREAVFELHPYVLREVGLPAAVQTLAEQAAERTGLELHLDVGGPPHPARGTLLYGLARELISNVARHAKAHTLTVELHEDDEGWLVLAVQDDGIGFDHEALAGRLAEGHIGLPSQRVRVESAGGTLEFLAPDSGGTRAIARVPQ
jgi:two-component system NarL family sensor kinase